MDRRPFFVAGLVLLAAATSVQAQAPVALKIGYINSAEILEGAPGAKEASAEFEREVQGFYAEVERMSQELQQRRADYQRQQLMLSPAAKTQREEELLRMEQEYQTRVQSMETQAGRRQQELVQPVMDKVNKVIEEIRAQESYSLIFDVAGGSIIAADERLDLTQEVLRRLRAQSGS